MKTNMLTKNEMVVMTHLVEAWNAFVRLPVLHDHHQHEFMHAIHAAQNIIFARLFDRQTEKDGEQ